MNLLKAYLELVKEGAVNCQRRSNQRLFFPNNIDEVGGVFCVVDNFEIDLQFFN